MASGADQARLKVKLANASWRRLRDRSAARQRDVGLYAEMIFRYLLIEPDFARLPRPAPPDPEETVYFELEISPATKGRLAERSAREQLSLATFGGALLEGFLGKYESDPRDLAMVHYLSVHLDKTPVLSRAALKEAIVLCDRNPGVRLPPGYFARWLHHRLRPIVSSIQEQESARELTLQAVEELLNERSG